MDTRREHPSSTTLERVVPAPRNVVWGLASDTNRFDRSAGLTPATYEWREIDGARVRVASARELGFDIEWLERPYQWVEGTRLHGERVFLKGPVSRAGYRIQLSDVPEGTLVRAEMYVTARTVLGRAVALGLRPGHRRALERYLAAIAELVRQPGPSADDDAPPSLRARRVLAAGQYDPVTCGPRSETNHRELRFRARQLEHGPANPALVARLASLLETRPDEELSQIRPFELADSWGAGRREVLRTFLHATRAGLVDLRWQINCPVCRVAADFASSLSDLSRSSHCQACNLSYEVDLASHVEAVFQCSPGIRKVEPKVYCASSPSFLPHVVAQLSLLPGEAREESLLLRGPVHVRTHQGHKAADLDLGESAHAVCIDVTDDTITAQERPAGQDSLLRSKAARPVTVVIERGGWSADVVLGSVMATMPEFYDHFGAEAPATGVELTVGRMALVFTDLTGSTAMYEEVGDARAFALVHEHFRTLGRCVQENGGAIVKTMGDAVMACFPTELAAVRAAIAMLERNDERRSARGLGLKVGMHAGPCLAVRANDRLDFFGTTVNIAARMQAKAAQGQLVLSEELASHADVREHLGARRTTRFEASLKGIQDTMVLLAVTVTE